MKLGTSGGLSKRVKRVRSQLELQRHAIRRLLANALGMVSSVGVFALTCNAIAAASESGLVLTEIKGEFHRSGTPVVGLEVISCKDHRSGPIHQLPCSDRISVKTDTQGRFSFSAFTGIDPASFQCHSPCARDPSWLYWFKVAENGHERHFVDGGLGFGLLYVRVSCDLDRRDASSENLVCRPIIVGHYGR